VSRARRDAARVWMASWSPEQRRDMVHVYLARHGGTVSPCGVQRPSPPLRSQDGATVCPECLRATYEPDAQVVLGFDTKR